MLTAKDCAESAVAAFEDGKTGRRYRMDTLLGTIVDAVKRESGRGGVCCVNEFKDSRINLSEAQFINMRLRELGFSVEMSTVRYGFLWLDRYFRFSVSWADEFEKTYRNKGWG